MKFVGRIKEWIWKYLTVLQMKKNNVELTGNVFCHGFMSLHNEGEATLGDRVIIRSGFDKNVIGGFPKCKFWVCSDAKLSIDDGSGISNSVIYAAENVSIGKNVLIGAGCTITDSDHHSIDYWHRCVEEHDSNIGIKPVKICDGAFIAAHSMILKGVTVGEKAVVSAGSVVTKDIPPLEMWGGCRLIS